LGGGRVQAQERIDPGVGVWVETQCNQPVEIGQPIFRVLHRDRGLQEALHLLEKAIVIEP